MSILDKLTEGIVNRDMKKEGAALLNKWENTGLLEGLSNEQHKTTMSRLLENQAKELLREASSLSNGGDVEGFAAVAFPIVRRVFGGLIANDLVSVQPMSLPSGLIFFLDFTFGSDRDAAGAEKGGSIYGQGVVGQALTGGVTLDNTANSDQSDIRSNETGFYNLNNGYSSPTGSSHLHVEVLASGTAGQNYAGHVARHSFVSGYTDFGKLTNWDPDISGSTVVIARIAKPGAQHGNSFTNLNEQNLVTLSLTGAADTVRHGSLVRRLTRHDPITSGSNTHYLIVFAATGSVTGQPSAQQLVTSFGSVAGTNAYAPNNASAAEVAGLTFQHAITDPFSAGSGTRDLSAGANALGAVVADTGWGLEQTPNIPEIDIKVDAVSVTAMTKKLKAKWTPELGQDLNAYHNLDAEVELTSILSEQIALEIDREILEDLVKGATAATYYWARSPGLFVNRETGTEVGQSSAAPDFTGTVSEWYETLAETINDVSAQIHRKTLRGGANFIVTSPEVANILEFTSGFRANVTADDDRGTVGAVKSGSLSKKWDVYVDPYFPRNVVLVGRKGNSFLESGYVYAPYVPLQVTPTIFGTEDFVPRKGVMTRYAKKMVRPDMYGIVIVRGLLGEAGATS